MALAAYHVIGSAITTETQLNSAGTGIEDVHVVPYVIDSGPAKGTRRSVKVTDTDYSPDSVQAAIEADLDATHQIAGLAQR
jgi:hypothetical protein